MPPVLSIDWGGRASWLGTTRQSMSADRLTALSASAIVFVRAGQLFQLSLARPGTPVARRISSLADACSLRSLFQVDADGLDAWAIVDLPGADADCATPAANRLGWVRLGTPATEPARTTPAGVTLTGVMLYGDAGQGVWQLAIDARTPAAPRLVAYDRELNRIEVAGREGVSRLDAPPYARLGGATPVAEGRVRVLDGDGRSLGLGPSVHTLSAPTGFHIAHDRPDLYLLQAGRLWRVPPSGAAQLMGSLDVVDGLEVGLDQTADWVVTWQQPGTGGSAVMRPFAKAGGGERRLIGRWFSEQQAPLALTEDALVDEQLAPSPGASPLRRLSLADGTTLRLGRLGDATLPSTSWLGFASASESWNLCVVSAVAVSGAPPTLWRRDADVFNPTVPGSLVRVTDLIR